MIVALITEYNPFHNGHLYHIRKARQITNAEYIVVLMSGNYVQRGEPAVFNKYMRTKSALLNGADLVLELPLYYATSSAEYFAKCSVKTLTKIKIIDKICFGSESGDIDALSRISEFLLNESEEYKTYLKLALAEGNSFPKSRNIAVNSIIGTSNEILNTPNNILAVEYIKNLKNINSKIEPITIKRYKSDYNSDSENDEISSATAARRYIFDGDCTTIKRILPKNAIELMIKEKNFPPNCLDNFSSMLNYILKTKTPKYLSEILDISDGLENRIISAAENNFLISDLLKALKTKRYTFTKLQRAILHILLDIKKEEFNRLEINGSVPYIRVLGFKRSSSDLLTRLDRNAEAPIVTNLKNAKDILDKHSFGALQKEILSTDLYYSALNMPMPKNIEYRTPLVII